MKTPFISKPENQNKFEKVQVSIHYTFMRMSKENVTLTASILVQSILSNAGNILIFSCLNDTGDYIFKGCKEASSTIFHLYS